MPQPYFAPTRPNESRSTQRSGVSGATSTVWDWPFTRRVYWLMSAEVTGVVSRNSRVFSRPWRASEHPASQEDGGAEYFNSTSLRRLVKKDSSVAALLLSGRVTRTDVTHSRHTRFGRARSRSAASRHAAPLRHATTGRIAGFRNRSVLEPASRSIVG